MGTALWTTHPQQFQSQLTSINKTKLPTTFNLVEFEAGTVNADIGGGKFDNGTVYLRKRGVENVIFDPYNRTQEWNKVAVRKISNGQADTATVNNVLNVIREAGNRLKVIRQASNALKAKGTAYFLIYEGSANGKGKPTKHGCWQENRKAATYIKELKLVFAEVKRKGKILIAIK